MNRKRQKQIEDAAVLLLQETGCYTYPPIKVKDVALRKGINVLEHDFGKDVSGVLMTDGARTVIGVSRQNNEKRQRFTIAHELGHHVLGHQREEVFIDTPDKYFTILNFRDENSSTGEHIQEREANAFAATLLMPSELIKLVAKDLLSHWDFRNDETDIINELATKFNVSNQAMGLRLSSLGLLW